MSREPVNLVEVGPRDGLQNESRPLDVERRVELIHRLVDAGLTTVEAGSFVSPKWVPQMADTDQVLDRLDLDAGIHYPVLVPNQKGLDAALSAGAKDIAIFGAASESFSKKNINCSIEESLDRFRPVAEQALGNGMRVRGYVSCLVACPYEGRIEPNQVVPVVRAMFEMGCYEVSLGDTIGRGTPKQIHAVLDALLSEFKPEQLALHCHDTYGMAIANIVAGLEKGIRTFDASVGGAGGCPYAPGASGNVATEDVVYLLESEGFETGVDVEALVETGKWLFGELDKMPPSKVNQAYQS
ncbi:hydroxymethylglutaryl-CoA lyase [Saccharospirillum salsuginis]|uniref:hydroxymethylglutaryl-CoA lyase n=1 Tax=Saccharospirillum salsuginis TaxID=418750 RepID=A0A918KQ74_9GAMM|nr:hydroxymethylglutaryl-CoA lyase [Saccharospirillum salsuginis]GGX72270.1 hydroxymethylglutaryl-CoA lyase [Saccharospirillum salsuginis]